jgi:hypothetical protein
MEISLAQSQAPQYQRDVDIGSSAPTVVAAVPASQLPLSADANADTPRSKVDKAQLLGITLAEQPEVSEEQTLKPYAVIMLPFREDDPTTTRKL